MPAPHSMVSVFILMKSADDKIYKEAADGAGSGNGAMPS